MVGLLVVVLVEFWRWGGFFICLFLDSSEIWGAAFFFYFFLFFGSEIFL